MARKRPTTQQAAILDDVVRNPDDDGPRLVYADWLEDNGQPQRAEIIRVQCAAEGDEAARLLRQVRERELLVGHWHEWMQELPAWARTKDRGRRTPRGSPTWASPATGSAATG
jgi:uncharacterized protein (TIGR02996 family)